MRTVYHMESPTWFAWIDDESDAEFGHETRYLFVEAASGATELVSVDWPPRIDDKAAFQSDPERARALVYRSSGAQAREDR